MGQWRACRAPGRPQASGAPPSGVWGCKRAAIGPARGGRGLTLCRSSPRSPAPRARPRPQKLLKGKGTNTKTVAKPAAKPAPKAAPKPAPKKVAAKPAARPGTQRSGGAGYKQYDGEPQQGGSERGGVSKLSPGHPHLISAR